MSNIFVWAKRRKNTRRQCGPQSGGPTQIFFSDALFADVFQKAGVGVRNEER
jgi:hypothetical protein